MSTTRVSARQFNTPHGTFYSLTSQAIADTGAVQAVALEEEVDVHGLTHSTVTNNSRIYADLTGSYEIIFSGIANTGTANKHIEVWIAINGSAVADTNTRVHIPTSTAEFTVAVAFVFDMTAGQYVELMTWGDGTDVSWLATAAAAGPDRPAVPSVIATMKMIGGY